MKKTTLTLLVALTVLTGLVHLHAQNNVVTYQGRVTKGGTNFTGSGQFKFALVTSSNASATATATANLTGSFVTSYTVNSGGSGYLTPPTVAVTGGGGSGATATANITGGVVTSITPGSAGSGYLMQPSVIIAAPPENIVYTTYWNNDGTFGMNNNEPGGLVTIPVSGGLFTARLGDTASMAALGAGLFQQSNLKLRVWFSDGVNGFAELTPPQPLTSAPYALAATSASILLGSLPASQVSGQLTGTQIANGTVTAAKVDSAQVQLRITGTAPAGTFLTGIAADGSVTASSDNTDWNLGGNAGTTAGTHFLGTTDNQPVVIKVNSQRALRIEPATNASYGYSPNMIGGTPNNIASNGIIGAVIGGGGWSESPNVVGNDFATVVGGFLNTASGFSSTAMGAGANASGFSSTAMGNSTTASGNFSTAMGYGGTASGFYSTVLGEFSTASGNNAIAMGKNNTASDFYSIAMGYRAKANHQGALVWGDSTFADIASTNANSVTMRASGGYRLLSADASVGTGVSLAVGGGSWITMSDRNSKENFEPVNSLAVLDKVMAMPLSTWNYKSQSRDTRHIGPMAQDFKAAFGVGETDTGITTVDADGVALAAIQGLNQKLEATEKRVKEKEDKISALEERLRNLEKLISTRLK